MKTHLKRGRSSTDADQQLRRHVRGRRSSKGRGTTPPPFSRSRHHDDRDVRESEFSPESGAGEDDYRSYRDHSRLGDDCSSSGVGGGGGSRRRRHSAQHRAFASSSSASACPPSSFGQHHPYGGGSNPFDPAAAPLARNLQETVSAAVAAALRNAAACGYANPYPPPFDYSSKRGHSDDERRESGWDGHHHRFQRRRRPTGSEASHGGHTSSDDERGESNEASLRASRKIGGGESGGAAGGGDWEDDNSFAAPGLVSEDKGGQGSAVGGSAAKDGAQEAVLALANTPATRGDDGGRDRESRNTRGRNKEGCNWDMKENGGKRGAGPGEGRTEGGLARRRSKQRRHSDGARHVRSGDGGGSTAGSYYSSYSPGGFIYPSPSPPVVHAGYGPPGSYIGGGGFPEPHHYAAGSLPAWTGGHHHPFHYPHHPHHATAHSLLPPPPLPLPPPQEGWSTRKRHAARSPLAHSPLQSEFAVGHDNDDDGDGNDDDDGTGREGNAVGVIGASNRSGGGGGGSRRSSINGRHEGGTGISTSRAAAVSRRGGRGFQSHSIQRSGSRSRSVSRSWDREEPAS